MKASFALVLAILVGTVQCFEDTCYGNGNHYVAHLSPSDVDTGAEVASTFDTFNQKTTACCGSSCEYVTMWGLKGDEGVGGYVCWYEDGVSTGTGPSTAGYDFCVSKCTSFGFSRSDCLGRITTFSELGKQLQASSRRLQGWVPKEALIKIDVTKVLKQKDPIAV